MAALLAPSAVLLSWNVEVTASAPSATLLAFHAVAAWPIATPPSPADSAWAPSETVCGANEPALWPIATESAVPFSRFGNTLAL